MANPLIVYASYWRDGEIIAVSSENAQFPAENTQDDSPSLYWRSAACASEVTLDVDLGEAKEYDVISIRGHNFTSGATIVLKGADDDAFTTNVVTDTLTHNGNNLTQVLGTARTKRYVRLSVTDPSNPAGFVQVGTIVLGKGSSLDRPPVIGDADGYANDTVPESGPSRVGFIAQEEPSREVKLLPWKGLSDASQLIVKALLEECGTAWAWLLCLDSTAPNTNTYWVILRTGESPVREGYGYWNWNAELEAVV